MKNNIIKVKVTVRAFSGNQVLRKELLDIFPNSTFNETGDKFDEESLIKFLSDADAVILGLEPMTEYVIRNLPDLKIISKFGVGINNIDFEAAKKYGKSVCWTPGVNKRAVAEQTLGFMIGISRNLFFTNNLLSQNIWKKNGGRQLDSMTIGIVGCGNIGTELIKFLQPFKCKILICDILDKKEICYTYNARQVHFNKLLEQSDIVTLHVPQTDKTHYMINKQTLNLMKQEAFLINTSRGAVVCEEDLKAALISDKIAGAALDVYEEEPPGDIDFLSLSSLITTPHTCGNSQDAVLAMGRAAIMHISKYL